MADDTTGINTTGSSGGGFFDKLLDSLISNAPDMLAKGGQSLLTQQTESDKLKVEKEKLEIRRQEVEEEIRNNKEDAALRREQMQIQLAIQAINANIAAAEDREFEAQQMMEQQKMSRAAAGDVTSALGQIVGQTQAGIK
jgi:hypothetical protein